MFGFGICVGVGWGLEVGRWVRGCDGGEDR